MSIPFSSISPDEAVSHIPVSYTHLDVYKRQLLLLLQALLLVPLTTFFTLSWSIWALPALLISLYLQMLCYSRPDRRQTLTVAGLMMGIAVLLYPPLLLIVPLSLSLLALMKVRRLRAYLAYLCGFMAILWLVLPTLYLWRLSLIHISS